MPRQWDCVIGTGDAGLGSKSSSSPGPDWMLAISGYWREDQFHSGHIAYYLACIGPGDWILDGVERNAILDDVTQEDVDAGRLDDDQIQAMWGMRLEEAQDAE